TALLGRILLSVIFIMSGFGKITGWSTTAGYMASKGMPLVPFFLAGGILVELAAGLSVLLGFRARFGAAALFLYLIATSLIFHNFWAYSGMEQQMQMINFMKNVATLGGLAMVVAFGP